MDANHQEQMRQEIYAAFCDLDVGDPKGLLQFQVRLSEAIVEAESNRGRNGGFNRHAFLLRRCQDSLAFRLLTPHAIRQLLGTASPRAHSIDSQVDSFRITQQTAKRYAAEGRLVFLTDLSHIVRVGDFIVCNNPCVPSIVEVKTGKVAPKHVIQGRRGRQASRSLSTIEYLTNDHGHIFDQPTPKFAVQSCEAMQFNWKSVRDVLATALRDGTATARTSDFDIIHVVHVVNGQPLSGAPLFEDIKRMRSPYFACHAVGLLNPEMLTLPPLVWPIASESMSLLMEEQLVIGHLVDLERFTDPLHDDFRVLSVSHKSGFSTERGGQEGNASARFINDVLFGFATIESTVTALRELHDLTKSAIESGASRLQQPAPMVTAKEFEELNLYAQPAALLETKDARFRIVRSDETSIGMQPAKSDDSIVG